MGLVFKAIDEYNVRNFKAFKNWTLTDATLGQYSASVNEALYVSHSDYSTPDPGINSSGLSKRHLFDSIYRAFYIFPEIPFATYGSGLTAKEVKNISNRISTLSIGRNYIGEGIKPGSIIITDDSSAISIIIHDDANGNLYDIGVSDLVDSGNLMGYWNFDEGFLLGSRSIDGFECKNHWPMFSPSAYCYGATFSSGVFNSQINFSGTTSSYAVIPNYDEINFQHSQEYAISVWICIPLSQSWTTDTHNSIVEKWSGYGGYPFVIRINNQTHTTPGILTGAVWSGDGTNRWGSVTSSVINDGVPHHIVFQKSASYIQLYVDSALAQSTDISGYTSFTNSSPLYLGGRGNPPGIGNNTIPNVGFPFSGSIDELRIYSSSLTQDEITILYELPSNTAYVGNVFYSHGILVITNLSGSYSDLLLGTGGNGFIFNYKSTKNIEEHDIVITAKASEFNMSFNPSLQSGLRNDTFDSMVTSSEWTPYITTIGLYGGPVGDQTHLLAVAKLAKPIKKIADIPLVFAIRFDT